MIRSLTRGPLRKSLLFWLAALLAAGGTVFGLRSAALGQDQKKKAPEVVDQLPSDLPGLEQIGYINEEISRLWQENKIEPSERCSDFEFIRRASLDIIGRIATVEEIKTFMADPEKYRRAMLVERLLASGEYAENFANIWSTLLMTRSAPKVSRRQMADYLKGEFAKKDCSWAKAAHDLIASTGNSEQNGAVNFVLMHMGEPVTDGAGKFDMVPVTSRTTKLFLGLQTQCTQCHDHPFTDVWLQKHFWGINAFFRQTEAPGGRPMANPDKKDEVMRTNFELKDNAGLNEEGIIRYERRNAVFLYTRARFLDGAKMPAELEGKSRREILADFIIRKSAFDPNTKSSYFAKAFVNRMWGHFFGLSFTRDSVDDFGVHNPASHPELLDKLASDWETRYGHNPRDLIRWICNSRAYGLSSVANPSNGTRDAERFFARMRLKAMTPEQLFESIQVATQPKYNPGATDAREQKEKWLDRLVFNFGNDEGEDGSFNGTVVQALLLMNGEDINKAIAAKDGTVGYALQAYPSDPRRAMAYLYMAALNRLPTDEEYNTLLAADMIQLPRVQPKNRQEYITNFYEDMYWAILNSNEFFLNH